ncbi:hypothetical protein ACP70R_019602 [Stipagrostis hirtigluma subsp. patula]
MAASSESLVVLGSAADLDTATSAVFFHEGEVGGADFSWPEAEKIKSTLTNQLLLQGLCDKYNIPADNAPVVAGGCAACRTPAECPNAMCVYGGALEAGMRLPLDNFYALVLRHFGLAPSQLAPNSWRYLTAFLRLCEDIGVDPLLTVFRYFFSICVCRGGFSGWHHFRPNLVALPSGRHLRLFSGKLPGYTEWKSSFFFLSPSRTPWPCPVKWGKPSREAVRKPVVTNLTTAAKTAIDKLLRRAGVTSIDVMELLFLAPQPTAVKVEAAATDGGGGGWSACGGGGGGSATTRKRKSPEVLATPPPGVATCGSPQSDAGTSSLSGGEGSATRELLDRMAGAFELAQMARAELDGKEQELHASSLHFVLPACYVLYYTLIQ